MEKLKKQIKNYQLYNDKTYIQYEQDKYSEYQNYRYKRVLYGLKSLPQEEVKKMCDKKKRRINSVHYKAQGVINIAKQRLSIAWTNKFFMTYFPKSKLALDLAELNEVDRNFKNKLTFKDLNLSKDDIITILMDEKILPSNFLSLKEAPTSLPHLKNESKT